jgi:hypothetical protein
MSPRRPPQRLHPGLALLLAGILHVGPFLALLLVPRPPRSTAVAARVADADVELALVESPPEAAASTAAAAGEAPAPPSTHTALPALVRRAAQRQAAAGASEASEASSEASEASIEAAAEPPGGAAEPAPERHIDLGLNGGVRRAAVSEGWLEPAPAPARQSPGALLEGLAAADAARGLARSSPAAHSAFQAARLAGPAHGIGVFDILTNERGVVLSVTLVNAGADQERWQRVGEELQGLLRERPLRVPPGAKGLLARLRIESGDLAIDLEERDRLKRGVPLRKEGTHAREQRDESTRAVLEPGALAPTLGVLVVGGASGDRIRVVLVSETAL